MKWVQAFVVAFGISNLGFAVFWVWMSRKAQHSEEELSFNVRAILSIRIATYVAIGVLFTLGGIYRSQWFIWAGISAMFAKILGEGWFRRRARTSGETESPDSAT